MEKLLNSLNNGVTTQQFAARLSIIRENIRTAARSGGFDPEGVRIMAVTKYADAAAIERAIAEGIDLIGENREQSLTQKFDKIDRERCEIHFIGQLQRNKAARVVKMVSMVQSLDSAALAAELDRQAGLLKKRLDVTIEVNIGRDPNKSGVDPDVVLDFAAQVAQYENLRLRGLMTILPLSATLAQGENYFSRMHALYVDIREQNRDNVSVDTLSMGMSGDYKQAVRHGATLVRLGTVLFG